MEIISRDRWGSKSQWRWGNMKLPATAVYLHHTVIQPTDYPYQDARKIEQIGISRFGQMSYSYLVHPNGTILEGAGTKVGAHTEKRNSTSFGIALVGTYVTTNPTPEQIESVKWLIHYLKNEKHWLNDSAVLTPHRAVKATQCPGDATVEVLPQFQEVWTPPAAPPIENPVVVGTPVEVDVEITPITYNLRLDDQGNGWIKIPYHIDKVLSVLSHSGTRPGVDGFYDPIVNQATVTPEDEGTIIVIRGGNPGGVNPIWVRVVTG